MERLTAGMLRRILDENPDIKYIHGLDSTGMSTYVAPFLYKDRAKRGDQSLILASVNEVKARKDHPVFSGVEKLELQPRYKVSEIGTGTTQRFYVHKYGQNPFSCASLYYAKDFGAKAARTRAEADADYLNSLDVDDA